MTTEQKKGNKPTHTAYTVRDFTRSETGEVDAEWSKIGAAWLHRDGKGFDAVLEAVPVNGRIVFRLNTPKPKKATAGDATAAEPKGSDWQA